MTPWAYSRTAVPSSAPSSTRTTSARPESVPKSTPTTWAGCPEPSIGGDVSVHTEGVSTTAGLLGSSACSDNIARLGATEDTSGKIRTRPAVMSDVARLAGVSHQTVSRVINDSSHVRPETRERVLLAMRQLDYRPNSVARALVTGRSKTLGVVSFDTTLYGPASTLFGIEQAAHEAGYFITIASLKALDRESVLDAVERLRILGVDGILVIAPQVSAARALLRTPAGVPLVALEAGPDRRRPGRLDRPVRRGQGGHALPARPRSSHGVPHRRP